MKSDTAFDQARRALLLDHPFFGSLVMHLEPREDTTAPRALWVDGKTVGYNPDSLAKMDLRVRAGLLAKGVMHCALRHHVRRGTRQEERWQKAADLVTNPLVLSDGLLLPPGAVLDPQYDGKSVEEVYLMLETEEEDQQQQSGGGQGAAQKPQQGGGQRPQTGQASGQGPQTGEVRDMPAEEGDGPAGQAEKAEQEEEWKIAMQQAEQNAKQRGDLPLGMQRAITKSLAPRTDWKEELRKYFQTLARDDQSWSKPNRRFIGSGLYLPAQHSVKMGDMVVFVDTSGSIGARELAAFAGEINAIAEDVRPERLYVGYCDAAVHRVDEFTADDLPIELRPAGGGGTDFRPPFAWAEQQDRPPTVLVYLTDMVGAFPAQEPEYPVIWVSTSYIKEAPFGDVIQLDLTQE